MLPLDDLVWQKLRGGYRTPYDASVPLRSLAAGASPDAIWKELWDELHHQGDVGEASYAAVPHLVSICRALRIKDWDLFALASIIEICRSDAHNPRLPAWMEASYRQAWNDLFDFGIEVLRSSEDVLVLKAVLGVLALRKGLFEVAAYSWKRMRASCEK